MSQDNIEPPAIAASAGPPCSPFLGVNAMAKLRFKWEVDDGYVGKDRPQTTYVDATELNECDTLEEAVALVEEAIQSDFEQKISACYDQEEIEAAVVAVFKK